MAFKKGKPKTKEEKEIIERKRKEDIDDMLIDAFNSNIKDEFCWEHYLHKDNVPMMPTNGNTKKQYQSKNSLLLNANEPKVAVFCAYTQTKDIFKLYKNDIDMDNLPEGFNIDDPLKGIKSDGNILQPNITRYKKVGDDLKYISDKAFKEETENMSQAQIANGYVISSKTPSRCAVWNMLQFKDILPEKYFDQFPQFKLQEQLATKKMSFEEVNLDFRVEAELLKRAMKVAYNVEFKEEDNNTAFCRFSKFGDKTEITVVAPDVSKFKSDADYLSTICHEYVHSTAVELNRKTSSDMKSKSYMLEELTAETGALYYCNSKGLDYFHQNAAYIKGWAKDNVAHLSKTSENAYKSFEVLDEAVNKYLNSFDYDYKAKLREELKEDVYNKYGKSPDKPKNEEKKSKRAVRP